MGVDVLRRRENLREIDGAVKDGVLLVDKPVGPTSAAVVRKVKELLGVKKVGHFGSLDPFASGLLLLGINEGTKIAEVFLKEKKSYEGTIVFGVATDTQDSTGKVLETQKAPDLTEAELQDLTRAFSGVIWQTPPMFSSLKKAGVRLYELARKGEIVDRPLRKLYVDRLRLWKTPAGEIGFEVTCSRGTYIRTLAANMGRFLGCGAHLKTLRRLACGHLRLEEAVPLPEMATGSRPSLVSLEEALRHLRSVNLDLSEIVKLRSGQQDMLFDLGPAKDQEGMVRLLAPDEKLVGLAQSYHGRWRLFCLFRPPYH